LLHYRSTICNNHIMFALFGIIIISLYIIIIVTNIVLWRLFKKSSAATKQRVYKTITIIFYILIIFHVLSVLMDKLTTSGE